MWCQTDTPPRTAEARVPTPQTVSLLRFTSQRRAHMGYCDAARGAERLCVVEILLCSYVCGVYPSPMLFYFMFIFFWIHNFPIRADSGIAQPVHTDSGKFSTIVVPVCLPTAVLSPSGYPAGQRISRPLQSNRGQPPSVSILFPENTGCTQSQGASALTVCQHVPRPFVRIYFTTEILLPRVQSTP